MRHFLLTNVTSYPELATSTVEGQIGVFGHKSNGSLVLATNDNVTTLKNLVIRQYRSDANGGPIVIPFHKNNFSWGYSLYRTKTPGYWVITFNPTLVTTGDYSIIICKKGAKFNERNKWTATVHISSLITGQELAQKLIEQINNNYENHGVFASYGEGTMINLNSKEWFAVYLADEFNTIAVNVNNQGTEESAIGTPEHIRDLAEKAAADAGYEYTYKDGETIYPNYPLYGGVEILDTGYNIINIRFNEPRDTKTRDEVVNQIVQIAVPKDITITNELLNICRALAGEEVLDS